MSTEIAKIQFQNIIFKESHIAFNRPGDYEFELLFTPSGHIFKSLNQFILTLKVNIADKNDGFKIEIITESSFSYPADADLNEYKDSYFIGNAPAIIFPYIRAYIGTLTAISGMPTLLLPTLNMTSLGENLKAAISEED